MCPNNFRFSRDAKNMTEPKCGEAQDPESSLGVAAATLCYVMCSKFLKELSLLNYFFWEKL